MKLLADRHIVQPVVQSRVCRQAILPSVHLEMKSFAERHIVHPVVQSHVRRQAIFPSVHLEMKSFAEGHIVVHPVFQSRSVHSQAFLLSVHLEVKLFAGHTVHPIALVLSVPVVMALQSQSPTSHSVRRQAFLLSVRLELKSFVNGHIVRPVVVLDAITPVLVLQDATILVIALDTLTILEVDLQNVIGVVVELHGTTVAVGTLRNTDVLNITNPIHLADGIILCLRNVDLLVIVASVVALLLELNFLAICLYPPAVLLHLFLDVNLDLLSHQQFAERIRLVRHRQLFHLRRVQNMNQSSLQCQHVLKPPCVGLRRVCMTRKSALKLLQ